MNQQQAEDLAVELAQTHRNGPSAFVWQQELADLDHNRTRTAIHRMRGQTIPPYASHIEAFRACYRSTEPPPVIGPNLCDTCSRPINDPRRWRHEQCQPRPEILQAMSAARAQLKPGAA